MAFYNQRTSIQKKGYWSHLMPTCQGAELSVAKLLPAHPSPAQSGGICVYVDVPIHPSKIPRSVDDIFVRMLYAASPLPPTQAQCFTPSSPSHTCVVSLAFCCLCVGCCCYCCCLCKWVWVCV